MTEVLNGIKNDIKNNLKKGTQAMSDRIYYSQQAERQARRQRNMMAFFALCLGVGVGTVLSMLFAPQAGEETRAALSEQAGQTFEEIASEIARLRQDVEERLANT